MPSINYVHYISQYHPSIMLIILVNIIHQFSPFFKSNQSINCIYSLRILSINLPIVLVISSKNSVYSLRIQSINLSILLVFLYLNFVYFLRIQSINSIHSLRQSPSLGSQLFQVKYIDVNFRLKSYTL